MWPMAGQGDGDEGLAHPTAPTGTAKSEWYRQVLMADEGRVLRLARRLDSGNASPGTPDDLDEIDRLLSDAD